ncbi:Yersinia protein of uncharacterised function (DUF3831) [Yersinia enterocolitica]|nr:Yersinia protein of uncharacterised function (DUF3831) [Yersinia enterocolitica]
MARHEPPGKLVLTKEVRRLYDLPVFAAAGTLSITSERSIPKLTGVAARQQVNDKLVVNHF